MTAPTMPSGRSTSKSLQIAAAIIGNAFEWYDFVVFGFFTGVISRLFFPTNSEYAALLLTTATFGVGFLMRPVGGIVLGIYADKQGRKAALLLIISLMTAAIAMIAFAPTYSVLGPAAPLIIVCARLLQGFAGGGEFASATSYLIESAPVHQRGFYGSWQLAGQGIAILMGAVLGAAITHFLRQTSLDSWGWRIPFLFGLLIGPVGLYIRKHLDETNAFLQTREVKIIRPRLGATLTSNFAQIMTCIGLNAAGTIIFYVILLYVPTFAGAELHLPLDDAFVAQGIGLSCMIVLIPISGMISDRLGRRPVLAAALSVYFVLSYPLFRWLYQFPSFSRLAVTQIVLCALAGVLYGPFSTALAEQFAANVRATALGFAYNVGVMVFGGFAQLLVTWLIRATGSPIAPSFYVMFGAALGLISVLFLAERTNDLNVPVSERATDAVSQLT